MGGSVERSKAGRRQEPALAGYRDWRLSEAKAHLSDVVRHACREGPQRITVYGGDAVVVVSAEQFAQMLAGTALRPSLHAMLSDSPLRDLDFGDDGERSPVRDIGL